MRSLGRVVGFDLRSTELMYETRRNRRCQTNSQPLVRVVDVLTLEGGECVWRAAGVGSLEVEVEVV